MDAEPGNSALRSALPALGILLLLVIGAIVVAGLLDDSRSVASLEPGDCLLAPEQDQVTQIDPVDCAQPHELEVIGRVTLRGAAYPGDDQVFSAGLDACEPMFVDYLGEPYDTSRWFLNAFTPSAEGWEAGDRTATCMIFQFDEDLEYVQLTGSAGTG
jgi:hypothetical protein